MFPNAVMDEPSEANGLIPIAPVISSTIMGARDNAVKELGPFLANKTWLAESLDKFQCIITTGYPPVLKEGEIDTYCPVVNLLDDDIIAA